MSKRTHHLPFALPIYLLILLACGAPSQNTPPPSAPVNASQPLSYIGLLNSNQQLPPLPHITNTKIHVQFKTGEAQKQLALQRSTLSEASPEHWPDWYQALHQSQYRQRKAQLQTQLQHTNASLQSYIAETIQKTNIALHTTNPADADILLSGTVLSTQSDADTLDHTPTGETLQNVPPQLLVWTLTHARTGEILSVGHIPFIHVGSAADQVLYTLIASPLNNYAKTPPQHIWPPSPLETLPTSSSAQTWVVAIGAEQHRGDLPPALYARNDALAFADFAQRVWNVPKSNIKTLTNQDATHAAITSITQEWLPRNVQPGDRVVFFASAHGAPDPTSGTTHIVAHDTKPAYLTTTATPIQTLYTTLSNLPSSINLVFLDTCFAGAGPRSTIAQGTRPLVPLQNASLPPRVIALTATAHNQITGTSPHAPHGLFTYHLLSALYGKADSNNDRSISLHELHTYLSSNIQRDAKTNNRTQTPSLFTPTPKDTAMTIAP